MHHHSPHNGFTVLEMTLVVAIAGLLMALSIPRLAHVRDASAVRGATSEIAAAFGTARQEALGRRTAVTIVVDTTSASVELRDANGRILRRSLGAMYGIVLTANRDSVVYDPRGLAFGLSNLSVTVRRRGIVDTLTMSRLGRVRW